MQDENLVFGEETTKVTLWQANVSDMQDQIGNLIDDAIGEKKETTVSIWNTAALDVFNVAQRNNFTVSIHCNVKATDGQAGTGKVQLKAMISEVSKSEIILDLKNPPTSLSFVNDTCRIAVIMPQEDKLTEVSGTANIHKLNGNELVIGLPKRIICHGVQQTERMHGSGLQASARVAPVPYIPRNISTLRLALRMPRHLQKEAAPLIHDISANSISFIISQQLALYWTRTFDRFLIFFHPHFGHYNRPYIFLAQKTSMVRSEKEDENFLHLRLIQALQIGKDNAMRWSMIPESGAQVMREIVQLIRNKKGS